MEKFKDIAIFVFLCGFPLAWMVNSAVAGWKEKNRHMEISACIDFLMQEKRDTAAFALRAVEALARQKSLVVVRDEEGNLTVRALDTAGQEEVRRALDAQAKEKPAGDSVN